MNNPPFFFSFFVSQPLSGTYGTVATIEAAESRTEQHAIDLTQPTSQTDARLNDYK